jgi:hypothetical protein
MARMSPSVRRRLALSVAQPYFSMPADVAAPGGLEAELERALAAARAHVDTVAHIGRAGGVSPCGLSAKPGGVSRHADCFRCALDELMWCNTAVPG